MGVAASDWRRTFANVPGNLAALRNLFKFFLARKARNGSRRSVICWIESVGVLDRIGLLSRERGFEGECEDLVRLIFPIFPRRVTGD